MSKDIAIKALETAIKNGASDAQIFYNEDERNILATHNGEIEKLQYSDGASLFIRLFVDGRYGVFSTNMMEADNIEAFINSSIKSTRFLTIDPCRKLPDPGRYFRGKEPDLGQYDKDFKKITAAERKDIILRSFDPKKSNDIRLLSMDCEYEDTLNYAYMIDSQGFEGESLSTFYTLSSECSVMGENESRPEGWWYHSAMHHNKLQWRECSQIAFQKALAKLNSKKLRSGRYNIVVENSVASKLISPILSALSGAAIQQDNSFLTGKLGERVFSEKMNLIDEPHKFGAIGAGFYDSEGVATYKMPIIEEGVVKTYFINTYYSHKMNMAPTIESPSVPILRTNMKNGAGIPDIISQIDKGVVITGFNGGNCNQGTGDFSYGIEGFYFEHGEIKHPVSEMNITGNMTTLWRNFIFGGDDARDCSRWQIPSIAFEEIDITGL